MHSNFATEELSRFMAGVIRRTLGEPEFHQTVAEVSGLEQIQHALRISWPRDEVDRRHQTIMRDVHDRCVADGTTESSRVDYVAGANISGFRKVADAMISYGVV